MTTEGQIKSLPIVVDEIYFCNPHCLIFSMMELMNLPVWRYYWGLMLVTMAQEKPTL